MTETETVWLGPPARYPGDPLEGPSVLLEDIRLYKSDLREDDMLHAMRGNSVHLAVIPRHSHDARGYIYTPDLGYYSVNDWIIATNYVWREDA